MQKQAINLESQLQKLRKILENQQNQRGSKLQKTSQRTARRIIATVGKKI